ncbi:YcjF family protein [Leptolyngbya sp. O-77]|uniref:YcjF family protein n=1 Tax=Leptolyngbya sp. O-77 TaxID=1080068 RepID=UPI00074D395C|nr:GTP-binding protein [Leptolyngbya sp. O-77]BAU41302.1 GTPase Era [Leptolyngbya sp. O-77]
MTRSRLLLIILALLIGLGFALWLVTSLTQLYTQLAAVSAALANLVVGSVVALLVGLLVALGYYAYLFLRPAKTVRSHVKVPLDRTEAAEVNLQAVQQQVEQIQDEVTRQALIDRSREIAQNMARGEFRVVVFGTGSAGKTSLVNAILGLGVGDVGPAMGTTTQEKTARFLLRGVDREIWITDTPGILEAGIAGTAREQQARQLAAEADLLLFVIDSDLRRSEYDPLRSLSSMGKRSILVLNKADLYSEADLQAILQQLRDRPPVGAVACRYRSGGARPQPFTLPNGERVQPQPAILPLLRRLSSVLREEGEDLIADNILLQSQQLGDEARQILDQQRLRQAEQVVERFQWIGAGVVSITPLPMVDLLAAAAVNAQMVVELGRVYGCEMNIDQGKELARSLAKTLVSLGVVRGAVEIFSLALQTNAGTFVIGRAIQGATAAYLTRIAGKSFIEYFRRNQDWGDGGISEVVQEQFQLNRRDEFMKGFLKEAIARVVEPLQSK